MNVPTFQQIVFSFIMLASGKHFKNVGEYSWEEQIKCGGDPESMFLCYTYVRITLLKMELENIFLILLTFQFTYCIVYVWVSLSENYVAQITFISIIFSLIYVSFYPQ